MDCRCFVWALALVSGIAADNIKVIQIPSFINATEGQSVLLNCTYEGPPGVGEFKWHKNVKGGTEVSDKTTEFSGRISRASGEDFQQRRDASITIKDVRQYDSGIYYCKVQVMGVDEKYGQGTTLHVVLKPTTEIPGESLLRNTFLYIIVGALAAFILFSAGYGLTKVRRLQFQRMNDRIYDDIPLAALEPARLQCNIAPCSNINFNELAPQAQRPWMDGAFSTYDEINPADVPPQFGRNEPPYNETNVDDFPPPLQCDEAVYDDIPPHDIIDMVDSVGGSDFNDVKQNKNRYKPYATVKKETT